MPAGAIDLGSAATLGALQGLTEFLPVSSSGHIAIGAMLFGLEDAPLTLSIVLHAGTLLATLILFAGDIRTLTVDTLRGLKAPREFTATDSGKTVLGVVIATLPTVVIGLGLRDSVESWSHEPAIVGACLLVSAVTVWSTRRGGGRATTLSWGQAFLVGLAQGLAVLPGVSRSGSTIAAAMLLGMRAPDAFKFSFLLSLPAVTGAVVLELGREGALAHVPPAVWAGGGIALVVGVVSLVLLKRLVIGGRFYAFAFYLVPVGLAMIGWGLFG
ncbi:MAG TPA: undecaprenyl-diphosphate phosphatase [Polyangiaceae bacterium LLY-WYZ-15_(1-7)]|nr:hypothetical protein [Sandaracinus sp.]HJL03351.1 undecaprenyl-diphosphate phosphatase [Polyangiaceae bacterium LLY-WYZ-15_(1-7)]MBJ69871.1 hypothetical protein [Sandaracinus sp.]HJL10630.1 undecaprenyl-diphosphate phosphatase [Polyangiaceae bacterium LLY-WYZ-15_(1-7)]HJL23844.1 undecaprenyl-diphosphate phosphatase [Polyangiaceae bacterium LLY-WYZ-15_(1-7)]